MLLKQGNLKLDKSIAVFNLPAVATCGRVHESGDFYSAAYVDKWADIARRHPGLTFYAYTKRLGNENTGMEAAEIWVALRELALLPNFVLIDSLQYGDVNYGDIAYCEYLGLVRGAHLCPCGGKMDAIMKKRGKKICGTACTYCQTKAAQEQAPVFLKH